MSKKLTWVFISIRRVAALLTNANGSYALSSKKIFVIETIAVDETSLYCVKGKRTGARSGPKNSLEAIAG